ncbi:hypothetical protein HC229_03115 [Flavobacterium sp. D33]|nr:hypothetical protein [Flavobacterium selenitireducens]
MYYTEKPLSLVIEVLQERGYTEDFNLLEEGITYKENNAPIDLSELVIDKTYRFTGFNDLDDEAILYAIHNKADGAKGIFVNGYGTYADPKANAIIDKIAVNDDGQDWAK